MRRQFMVALIVAVFFSGWYYYSEAHPCISPRPYSLGALDPRFNLEREEVQKLMIAAETIWETALGRELFTYTDNAAFKINFVYDDRQARSQSADAEKEALDQKEHNSQSVSAEYARLLADYAELKKAYETKVANYNQRLKKFNDTVASYNQAGGAPQEVFDQLQKTERDLKKEEQGLETEANKLTALAKDINVVSQRGNDLISEYNEGVVEYNQTYSGGEEFTQGEFQGDAITIYHFKDQNELKNVLVHEFGHAIGLPHVEEGVSIMYYLMDKQPATSELSPADLAALGLVCKSNDSIMTRFHHLFSSFFSKIHLI